MKDDVVWVKGFRVIDGRLEEVEEARVTRIVRRPCTDHARALRTVEGSNQRCQDCGAPHNIDTSIPSPIWNQIESEVGMLCTMCIDDRMAALGLTAEAEFYFVGRALRSKLYGPLELGGGPPLSCDHATAEKCGAICGFCLRAWWDAARPVSA